MKNNIALGLTTVMAATALSVIATPGSASATCRSEPDLLTVTTLGDVGHDQEPGTFYSGESDGEPDSPGMTPPLKEEDSDRIHDEYEAAREAWIQESRSAGRAPASYEIKDVVGRYVPPANGERTYAPGGVTITIERGTSSTVTGGD